jgi:hypothetical protein
MRIVSTFLPGQPDKDLVDGPNKVVLMAFDTLVGEKSLVVGITVGKITRDAKDAELSQVGVRVMHRVMDHHALNYPQSAPVIFAGVASVSNAVQRVRNVLANAPHQAALMLVCADDKVYDAAFPALRVDLKSANMDTQ